jgi:hypothetical protein
MSELFILQWHRQIDLDLVVEVMLTIVKIDIISTIVTTLQDAREELCAWHLILKVWIAKQKNIGVVVWYTWRILSKPV